MKRGTKSTREYIKARIPQLMDDMNKATDPYGVEHEIPNESSIKINTMRKRIINVTEIK